MLFTINSRRLIRRRDNSMTLTEDMVPIETEGDKGDREVRVGLSEVERRVEGYQGDRPFGVSPSSRGAIYHLSTMGTTGGESERIAASASASSGYSRPMESPGLMTPGEELVLAIFDRDGTASQRAQPVRTDSDGKESL
jgi:hypothetical protein